MTQTDIDRIMNRLEDVQKQTSQIDKIASVQTDRLERVVDRLNALETQVDQLRKQQQLWLGALGVISLFVGGAISYLFNAIRIP